MDHASDQEQLEALQKWWKENGMAIVGGLLLGLVGVGGWQYWQGWRVDQAETASALYERVTVAVDVGNDQEAESALKELAGSHSGSPYAALAAFAVAAEAIRADDLEAARTHLEWVVENGAVSEHREIARLRLARVLLAAGDPSGALAQLDAVGPVFRGESEELRGDVFVAQGDFERARQAYQTAAAEALLAGGDNPWLQMKLENLGTADETL